MTLELPDLLDCDNLLRNGAELLRNANIASPRREARLLLAHALGVSANELISPRFNVGWAKADEYSRLVERRCKREPLAYITGRKEFWSLEFVVSPAVLIPRPESETLVEAAVRKFPSSDQALNVLDLGTGSGCLLLAFLSERPAAHGLGIDRSDSAVAVAAQNARSLSLNHRVQFETGNWLHGVSGRFDIVFANPPYIATGELQDVPPDVRFEPVHALDGGRDGLDAYRQIVAGLPPLLAPCAMTFLEIGQGQAEAVCAIFRAAGFTVDATDCDLAGIPRCVALRFDGERQP